LSEDQIQYINHSLFRLSGQISSARQVIPAFFRPDSLFLLVLHSNFARFQALTYAAFSYKMNITEKSYKNKAGYIGAFVRAARPRRQF
jgi:hypothetical protein